MTRHRTAVRPAVAKFALAGLVVGCLDLVELPAAHATPSGHTQTAAATAPPRNPTDGQLQQAQARTAAAARRLSGLQAQLTRVRGDLSRSAASLDLAIAAYQRTTEDLRAAVTASNAARAAQKRSDEAAALARLRSGRVLRAAFATAGRESTELVFGARDPSELLAARDVSAQLARRRNLALSGFDLARIAASNAEATTRGAVQKQQQLTDQAARQRDSVLSAVRRYRSAQTSLQSQERTLNEQAVTAYAQLRGLRDRRAAYTAWQAAEARRIAAEQAARRRAAEQAARRAAEAEQRRRQQEQQQQQSGSDGSGSSGGSGTQAPPPAVSPPVNQTGWTRPMRPGTYEISSCYCERWGTFHQGVDLAAPYGTPIYAVGPGTVVAAGPASGFGNWVVIDHYDGTLSIYGHMRDLNASVGQRTRGGELIAWVGSEGESTGPHLHFEVRLGGTDGSSTDPTVWLARRGVDI